MQLIWHDGDRANIWEREYVLQLFQYFDLGEIQVHLSLQPVVKSQSYWLSVSNT